ncbi:hypothetical protein Maes01_02107 [Microbulbifer aestuariivivens]|uniref:O-antigen ligase domain-containing protein n=1 Tax=Microbulbifer aestuariivivens TaxID=1908308 RepID=A0ABP9WQR0_9GAMM
MFERVMPEYFAGALWADQTVAHPLGIAALIAALAFLFLVPRRYALLSLIFIAVALPGAQRIAVFSLDFTFIRIIILGTLLTAAVRGHTRGLRLGLADGLIGLAALWSLVAGGFLQGGFNGVVSALGDTINTLGAYLVGRIYIRSLADLHRLLLWLAAIAVPMLAFFIFEKLTGRNLFGLFGGVPEETMMRNDSLRAQGPFSHPLMAGVFWASLLPCLFALWMARVNSRLYLSVAILCMTLIVVMTASSTPLVAIALGVFAVAGFIVRRYLRIMIGLAFVGLVGLHFTMEMPVWHLISRIDLSGGSTGWHRYNLIEQSINHFHEWWAFGTLHTGHWGWGLQDITNQYVLEGTTGGILQLLLFVALLACIFLQLSNTLRRTRNRASYWLLWGIGASLFVHCVSFLAVSYFGQTVPLFYLFLGGAASLTLPLQRRIRRPPLARLEEMAPLASPA